MPTISTAAETAPWSEAPAPADGAEGDLFSKFPNLWIARPADRPLPAFSVE